MAYSSEVHRTPPTKTRPALALDTYRAPDERISMSSSSSSKSSMMAGKHRRPSLFDISNITPPPTEVSHFSDPSSTPVKETSDFSGCTPPPAPRSSRKDLAAASAIDLDMGRALFISSPQPQRPNLVSFLSFTPSPFAEYDKKAPSPYLLSPEGSPDSFGATMGHGGYNSSSSLDCSPTSPVLHIKLGADASGAAQPMVQPMMPGMHHKASRHRPYDFDARNMASQVDHFFGSSSLQGKAERGGYGRVGIARTNAGWDRQSDFEPLLASPRSPSARHHVHSHHPYAQNQSRTSSKRKSRPPPLNLAGISFVPGQRSRAPPQKRQRSSVFIHDSTTRKQQVKEERTVHPVDVAIQDRLLPSLMPADGPGSGLKRKMSLKNMLSIPSRLRPRAMTRS